MPTINDFKPALDARDADMIRNALVQRVIYAIGPDEDPTDFVANTDGVVPLGLGFNGGIFWLDPDDLSSAHDGVAVIVTDDGYRYKLSDFVIPYSVLAADQDEPPSSSAIGDAFLTSSAPSGEWASHEEKIAVWTSRGWVFLDPQVGRLIYVADGTKRWMFLDEDGNIVERFDYQDATIPDGALIGGQRRFIVESQTVNTPPGSPAVGQYWIIGSAPTGAWSGETGNIATSYDGLTWVIIPAVNGLEAYDRANAANYIFRTGVGWVSAAGAWGSIVHQWTAGTGSTSSAGGSSWNGTDDPTTSHTRRVDDVVITHQATAGGKLIRFVYQANIVIPMSAAGDYSPAVLAVALYRDSEATSVEWINLPDITMKSSVLTPGGSFAFTVAPRSVYAEFVTTSVDAASHTYRVAVVYTRANDAPASLYRRTFTLEEAL